MRWLALLLAAFAAATASAEPAAHPGVADPLAFVQERYAAYERGDPPALALDSYASERLRALLYAHDEAAGGEEIGEIDFWVDGRGEPIRLRQVLREPGAGPGRQQIQAWFRAGTRPANVRFLFVRERGAWYLDEAIDEGNGRWTLTCLLAQRPGGPRPCPPIAPAAAEPRGVEDPRAFVREMYERYRTVNDAPIPEPRHAYSARLAALFEAYDTWQRAHQDLVGSLAFDWWANAQDWQIRDIWLVEFNFPGERKVVEAHWRNYDRADSSRFFFIRENGRWVLDEVINGSGRGGDGWTLSALLRERPE